MFKVMEGIRFGANGVTLSFNSSSSTFEFSRHVRLTNTYAFGWISRSQMQSSADGLITLLDNAGTSFNRLTLGGTTASFPAIKRNAANINFRLADDSADCGISAGYASFSGGMEVASAQIIGFSARSRITSPADGNLLLRNNAQTDFGLLQFGGITASFPSLKRNTTELQVKLADDSGFTNIRANGFLLGAANGSITGAADGVVLLRNNAGTDFSRICLGGTTNTFPSIKRSSNGLAIRLADDSGYTHVDASAFNAFGTGPGYYFGGTTTAFPAIKRVGANLEVRLGDDSAFTILSAKSLYATDYLGFYSGPLIKSDSGFRFRNSTDTGDADIRAATIYSNGYQVVTTNDLAVYEHLIVACSDETSPISAGNAKVTFRMPYNFAIKNAKASLNVAQTSGSALTVDIKLNGTSIFGGQKLAFDNTEKTTETFSNIAFLSITNAAGGGNGSNGAAADDEITIDVTQIGDGSAKGLKVYLIGQRWGPAPTSRVYSGAVM